MQHAKQANSTNPLPAGSAMSLPGGNNALRGQCATQAKPESVTAPIREVTLLAALVLLSPIAHAGDRRINIQFPPSPGPNCAGINTFPDNLMSNGEKQRNYVQKLVEDLYPEIVKVYGEPLMDHSSGVTANVYFIDGTSSMYLNHKADLHSSLTWPLISSLIKKTGTLFCDSVDKIPDHSLFLHLAPGDGGFEHLFTHELIHVFHDRMHFREWYTRSWVEEGMTEAAAEIVADQMKAHYLRDVRGYGINSGPAANLKHYDMWNFTYNGMKSLKDRPSQTDLKF